MKLLSSFLRFFFFHFYHDLAWTYEFVAGAVSLGRWNRWIDVASGYVQGQDILELGFGRGHLQARLLAISELRVFGLDESLQMTLLASGHLRGIQRAQPAKLTRGRAQHLPYPAASFDTVVSTFPSEYIFDPVTLAEVRRVLRANGRLVIIPGASIVGRGGMDRVAALIFRITHQAPASPSEALSQRVGQLLRTAGFQYQLHIVEIASSLVYIVQADRPERAG